MNYTQTLKSGQLSNYSQGISQDLISIGHPAADNDYHPESDYIPSADNSYHSAVDYGEPANSGYPQPANSDYALAGYDCQLEGSEQECEVNDEQLNYAAHTTYTGTLASLCNQ